MANDTVRLPLRTLAGTVVHRGEDGFWQRFAWSLAKWREDRAMSQETLSSAIGKDRTSVANMEAGRHRPNLFVVCAIALALKVPLDSLLGIEWPEDTWT